MTRDEYRFNSSMRETEVQEAMTDIGLETMGDQSAIFELASDHFGSDEDAHYMIHNYDLGVFEFEVTGFLPRTEAFLRLLKHIPADCPECN